jgi:hypothetical protein
LTASPRACRSRPRQLKFLGDAAGALGIGAAIGWALEAYRPKVAEFLGLTAPAFLRTIISLGHPTEAAQQPRSAPGTARRPIAALVRER